MADQGKLVQWPSPLHGTNSAEGRIAVLTSNTRKNLQIWSLVLQAMFLGTKKSPIFTRANAHLMFVRIRPPYMAAVASSDVHDDVIKWKHFPRYWPFGWGIHRPPVNSPHKGQWRGALMFSLICVWINDWVNNREAGDLRRYRAHYDVTLMFRYKEGMKHYHNRWSHWGRVTHICVVDLTIIGSDNGLSPGRRQAIIWTNAGILLIGPLGTNFSEILIESHTFSFKKMHLKMSSAKWRPFCLGLNELMLVRNQQRKNQNLAISIQKPPTNMD